VVLRGEPWGRRLKVEFVAEGMSEDAAMLLAYEAGASLIVTVGAHATMVEFLDKGRRGMASTFLTRLRLGPVVVDAKGVNRLYESRIRRRDLVLLIASALLAVVVMAIGIVGGAAYLACIRFLFPAAPRRPGKSRARNRAISSRFFRRAGMARAGAESCTRR